MFSEELLKNASQCEEELKDVFQKIDEISYKNTEKVLKAFSKYGLSERHFNPTSGYGYNDDGRDLADKLYAEVFGTESGFVRYNIISGTHAIAIALYGLLRPGDTLYAVTGRPYDTLDGIIGFNDAPGSLKEYGVKYRETSLVDNKTFNTEEILSTIKADKSIKVIHIQRSKGYASRRTLTASEITELYYKIKEVSDAFVFVDNCYGEFTNEYEPKADILAGSLIKNPGGGIAEAGGYIVGTEKAVSLAASRLTVPCIGTEAGASLGANKPIIKGLFYAPHTVAQAKKTSHFASLMLKKYGFDVSPEPFEFREDIIQIIYLKNRENLISFCQGIQSGSPVDSFALPIPGDMPGYEDEIIMAAGAFTQGSSIELSADAPLREPFAAYLQGGLTYESGKYGVLTAIERLISKTNK